MYSSLTYDFWRPAWRVGKDPQEVTNAEMKHRLSKGDPFHVMTVKEEYFWRNNNIAFAA